VEAALSIYLENFATSLSSREQLAIADFAKSLLVIPKVCWDLSSYGLLGLLRFCSLCLVQGSGKRLREIRDLVRCGADSSATSR
jgi:hypothetical protein